jgi:hypothetical protein
LRGQAFDDPTILVGAVVLGPLEAGELVQAGNVVKRRGTPGAVELTFPVDRSRLSDAVKVGERVDIVATYSTSKGPQTSVVVRGALVVALARARGSLGDTSVVTVSLEHAADETALADATQVAKITLVRVTGSTAASSSPSTSSPPSSPSTSPSSPLPTAAG